MMQETHIVENKTIWKDEWLEWICGFANAQGGILNVGTADDGTPVGLADIKSLLEKLPNKIINKLGIVSDVNKRTLNGIDYIEISVNPSNVAITLDGVIYYRSGATNQTLRGEALERFLLSKMGMHWDEMEIPNATIEKDIDRDAVDYFLKKAIEEERLPKDSINDDTQTVLKNLHLISDDGKLRIAAIILFGSHPENYVRSIDFRIGRFISDESDLLFQDVIQGDVIRMADRIMKVLRSKYLVSYIGYKGMKRTEPLEIPEAALREIIYNALIHRLYTGTFVQMKVYNDRVSVWNEGTLPEGFPVEMLMQEHSSRQRNPLIAKVFFLAGFVETWGRGIKKIRSSLQGVGLPDPVFEENCGGIRVTIQRPRNIANLGAVVGVEDGVVNGAEEQADNKELNEFDKQFLLDFGAVDGVERSVYNVIKANPEIRQAQIKSITGISVRTISRILSSLKQYEYIKRKGGDRYGSWIILK